LVGPIKAKITSTGLWIKTHTKMHSLVALLVFAIGLGATLYYWGNLRQGVDAEMNNAYTHEMQAIGESVRVRLGVYENFLRSSSGLFSVHTGLTQDEWVRYQDSFSLAKNYPDVEGTGVSRYLKQDEVPAYLERRRAQGDADFAIFPAGDRGVYAPITFSARYGEDVASDPSRGYDTYTEPTRRAAMERAVETNKLTMTGKVNVLNDVKKEHSSFVLYYPVYKKAMPTSTVAERRNALLGFVYLGVDTAAFVNSVLSNNQNPNIAMQIYDQEIAGGEIKVYESGNFTKVSQGQGAKVRSLVAKPNGHTWRFVFAAAPELLPARERQLPEQALWRGLVTCIFFAGLVWYLITDRERKYARQKREEVQTAKDDLLSLASHQLRTPATIVKQYVGMLLQGYAGDLTARQLDMLDNAYSSNERQLEIINQLLYVARLDAGRITLHPKRVDLGKLIRDLTRELSATVAEREQQLNVKLPKRQITAHVDPHYIRMVLENLISNAIKYTPEKGSITLELKRTPGSVIIIVRDNGVGIPAEVQATIFEKFTRVENELSTDVNGSGVGLYLTKQIVELHGGTIEVESTPEQGSAFTVRIPSHPLTVKQPSEAA
jgi:signal transduction histidine kinase